MGSTPYSLGELVEIFSHQWFDTPTEISPTKLTILWDIRLPRVFLAFLVGGGLAISGTVAQSVLQNAMASPFTLGVSSGASFGAALVILLGVDLVFFGWLPTLVSAFVFGVMSILFVLWLSYRVDFSLSPTTVVLTGMVLSLFFNGLLTLLTSLSGEHSAKLQLWQMGSFAMRGWEYVWLVLPIVGVGLGILLCYSNELDLFSLGSAQAQAMGVNTTRFLWIAFLVMAVITAGCISITGTIGFVDLISPHVARKFVSNRHKELLPASFLVGGSLMVATDTVARTILSPSELSVGAVTALLGAPFFFYLYQKDRQK